ncbi:GyrI-like domain-containing protein [Streptomyces griseoincarnatus]
MSLWSAGKTGTPPGTAQRSRNPPDTAALNGAVGGNRRPSGRRGCQTHELFTEDHGHATVYLPAETPLPPAAPATVRELDLPARTAAVATHTGPHDDLDLTYGAVGSFAARHGLRAQNIVEEVYLVGPRDTGQPERWRTLVAWLTAPEHT